ncbi:hypothetical protein [Actinoplanes sp. HUAS TT8]|uniref:hypothetical protein n=1 Tax=Actinoplanes sp. HUAS TT8 TaxID=3447453 RepID=UPI003F52617A
MPDRTSEQREPAPHGSKRRVWPAVLSAVLTAAVSLPLGGLAPYLGSPAAAASRDDGAQPAPDGRIPMAELREALLDVPAWPDDNVRGPSGPLQFHDGVVPIEPKTVPEGQPPYGDQVLILSVTYGDIDHDGADETIVELACMIEGGSKQLVAYDRDGAGHIVSLGRITATTGPIRDLRDGSARVGAAGVVSVLVGDYQRCCDDRTPQIWQTRGYARRDGRFQQVDGPARMPVNPHVTDLRITTGDLALGPAAGGFRTGTLDVTVTHRSGAHPSRVTLTFYPPEGLVRTGDAWPRVTGRPDSFTVTVAAPRPGGSARYSFAFRRPAALTGGELPVSVAASPQMSGSVPWNSDTTAMIRTVPKLTE